MAIGLGALQTVLEEGNKDDWFESSFIVRLSVMPRYRCRHSLDRADRQEAALNLRLLARRISASAFSQFLLGIALYGLHPPVYLSRMQGYNASRSAWCCLDRPTATDPDPLVRS